MKKWNIFQILGCLLILGSLGLLVFSWLGDRLGEKDGADLVVKLEQLLPERTLGVPDTYGNPEMPVIELEGSDFSGLVEIPAYGLTLPIGSQWDSRKLQTYPCRFSGSVYDSTLVIGGMDREGQFDFFDQIGLDAGVTVTDMTGAEFHYTVARIDRSDTAEAEKLMDNRFDMTLFVRDAHSMQYILVRCRLA